jgi:CxxC motif-containing protein
MERKTITCIECPRGCSLTVDIENCRVTAIKGNQCPKGLLYGKAEVENPMRTLTTTVVAVGLALTQVPVRTSKPIPKDRLLDAMKEIRRLRIDKPVFVGDIIAKNFLGLGVELIATREAL